MVHLPDLCNILNGLIKISTDYSMYSGDLIFIRLAAQLYYFELKNIYMANYFYLDSDKWFKYQNMIKISYSGKKAPVSRAILPPYCTFLFKSPINRA